MLLFNENHDNEVHMKIGGDHGGGSFKMSYQIANVVNPNTIVFSLFEAKDYRINMKTGLSRFAQQIDELQSMMWRLSTKFYFMINIFMKSKFFHLNIRNLLWQDLAIKSCCKKIQYLSS